MDKYSPIIIARFWSKVDVRPNSKECWNWKGALRSGYGNLKINKQNHTSSRVAFELFSGQELGENMALHTCDNKKCCNPDHIYAGSASDNMIDRHQRKVGGGGATTADQVRLVRQMYFDLKQHPDFIAHRAGVTSAVVQSIIGGNRW